MKTLHSIKKHVPSAWLWGCLVGGNGRILSGVDRFWVPIHHLFYVERQPPPKRGRRYFNPWGTHHITPQDRVRPACGPLKTRSTKGRISAASVDWNGTVPRMCPQCIAAQGPGNTQNQKQMEDPWATIAFHHRDYTPDPVSGE